MTKSKKKSLKKPELSQIDKYGISKFKHIL